MGSVRQHPQILVAKRRRCFVEDGCALEPLFQEPSGGPIDKGNQPRRATGSRVGILAYGSLLTWPGSELHPLINERIDGVPTPFAVEFARTASRRSGAPTLAPVITGGGRVDGSVLLLHADVDLGISYLMGVRASGIETPISPAYEKEILRPTATTSLAEAHTAARANPIT